MARTSAEVTESELVTIGQWAQANNIIWDGSKQAEDNLKLLVLNYDASHWNEDITEANLTERTELLRPYLKFYDANTKMVLSSWQKMTPEEHQVITEFWQTPRRIEHSDYNNALILGWLTGHNLKVTHPNIAQAVDKLVDKLTWVTTSTFQSPIPQATKDAHTKPGSFITDANKSPSQYKKENDDALAKARGDKTSQQSIEVNDARREAEGMKGRTHADTERILSRLDANKDGSINWVSTLRLRKLEQQAQERARQLVKK